MNLTNEILQWCLIVSAVLLTLACYRQVAAAAMGSREYITESFGPSVGSPAPERMRWFFSSDPSDDRPRMLLFVSETCKVCAELIHLVRDSDQSISPYNRALPWQVGFVVEGGPDFVKHVRAELPDSIVDTLTKIVGDRHAPKGYPFMLEFDSAFITRRKVVGSDILVHLFGGAEESQPELRSDQFEVDGRNEV